VPDKPQFGITLQSGSSCRNPAPVRWDGCSAMNAAVFRGITTELGEHREKQTRLADMFWSLIKI
jgi:hypothetical protein